MDQQVSATPGSPRFVAAVASATEKRANDFVKALREALDGGESPQEALESFASAFRRFQAKELTQRDARQEAANVIADQAPSLLEEFIELFDASCATRAWAAADAWGADAAGVPGSPNASPALCALGAHHCNYAATYEAGGRGTDHDLSSLQVSPDIASAEAAAGIAGDRTQRRREQRAALTKVLAPTSRGNFTIWFTIINLSIIVGVFAYMTMDYSMFLRDNIDLAFTEFDLSGSEYNFEFLRVWGGRWAPQIENGDWWRWFTSLYLHQNLAHILSNMLLFLSLSVHLELHYGWWRLTLVWIISGVGGNFVSAAVEDVCTMVVGASGAVFGLMGLFIADLIINFESISRPVLRVLVILTFVVIFIVSAVLDSTNVSHASHIGGLICGLFPSMIFIPNAQDQAWKVMERLQGPTPRYTTRREQVQRQQAAEARDVIRESFWRRRFGFNPLLLLGAVVVVIVFVALPIFVYQEKFSASAVRECPGYDDVFTDGQVSSRARNLRVLSG